MDETWTVVDLQGFIYILQLEKDKFYVGYTERKDGERFKEHFSGNGSVWTKTYKPIQVVEWRKGTLSDEDTVTLECMRKYGWWNVRGGRWCDVNMTKPPEELFKLKPIGFIQKAFTFIGNVLSYVDSPEEEKKGVCFRCGRHGHWVRQCYAKTHVNGTKLKSFT
jgi:predicted GIY-YIG superfamily endonuclease